jgi:hypothetical protein
MPLSFHATSPERTLERLDAAIAREGIGSDTEKGTILALIFTGISGAPATPFLRQMWKESMLSLLADLIRAYHPDDDARMEFVDKFVMPALDAIRKDIEDGEKALRSDD